MAVIRKRLIFWLIKAYIKKSGKTLILCFILGLFIFFAIAFSSRYFSQLILPFARKETIGLVGAYRQDNLPTEIVDKLSSGLTKVAEDGTVQPNLASNWETQNNGKTYIFHIKPNQKFNDGKEVTSDTITYDFTDVTTERPNKQTIVYKLKDTYAPFLVTVSRPIFTQTLTGVGQYRLEAIKLNGNFVQSLTLASVKNKQDTIRYEFYPSEESLKTAFLLGEVTEVNGLDKKSVNETELTKFPNTTVKETPNYSRLVTLFFNTNDGTLSDKKLRLGLSYALPDTFVEGKRAHLPYAPISTYYNSDIQEKKQDYEHAKLLFTPADSATATASANPTIPKTLTIKTLKKYRSAADTIVKSWMNIGIAAKVEEVDTVPDDYQIFLGDFSIPRDPDQYTLWHSDQRNNITRYKNLRIDKLLEDGRKTSDPAARKQLYMDFQKYLMEDEPAAFLYFPTEYTVVRK
jgi:peptide/nickel transport system substrate-binding protein